MESKENQDIPKVIHYCWFGGKPLPKSAEKCIKSWRKFLPDYEIKRWDESNFDVNCIPYVSEAYAAKKYAFVSDYARFWILYREGGLYFDTDVEVIKPMEHIISAGPFMGFQNSYEPGATPDELGVAPGLGLGVNPGLGLYKEILDVYSGLRFRNPDGSLNLKTVVEYTTETLCKYGLRGIPDIQTVAGVTIYPGDYFSPIQGSTREMKITPNTVSIHYGDATWVTGWPKYRENIKKLVGPKVSGFLVAVNQRLKRLLGRG